jgi:hypothetical protein
LDIGQLINIEVDTAVVTSFETEGYVPKFTTDNTTIVPYIKTHSNFKTLTRPNIFYDSAANTMTFQHSNTDPNAAVNIPKQFIFGVRRLTDDSWENIEEYLVTPVDTIFSNVTALRIDLSPLNINPGDSIRVKSCADYFNDSAYAYYTFTDGSSGSGGIIDLPTADLDESTIGSATFISLNDPSIKDLWSIPSKKL